MIEKLWRRERVCRCQSSGLGLADARKEMEKIAKETAYERNEAWLNRRKRASGS